MERFILFIGRALLGLVRGILHFVRDEIFLPLFRVLIRSIYFWIVVGAMILGWAQKNPGSRGAALVSQTLAQGCQGFDAILPTVVAGALLYYGLTSILGFRPGRRRGGRGHGRNDRDRH